MVNPAFTEITGYSPEESLRTAPNFLASGNNPNLLNAFQIAKEKGSWKGEVWILHKDGHSFESQVCIQIVRKENGEISGYITALNDISQYKQAVQEIDRISRFDPLTHLPNRSYFFKQVNQEIKKAKEEQSSLAFIHLDIDHFNIINDTLGHHIGDAILQEIASRLTKLLNNNHLVARLSGDEYGILICHSKNIEEIKYITEQIIHTLQIPYLHLGQELNITSSLGISLYPNDGNNSSTLLQYADIALYRAKKQGRNTYQFYSSSFKNRTLEHLVMQNSLRHALTRQEFSVYYQPFYEVKSGRIIGAEALLRWNHPDLGLINPNLFIPLAEETGLMSEIGNWVIKTVCKQGQIWEETLKREPLFLSVNLSNQQVKQADFLSFAQTALKESGFNPKFLELELTENIIMDNPEQMIRLLNELKMSGVSISIDDFGTGYSSLSQLSRLPIDKVKIDQSFLINSPGKLDNIAIISAIVSMSHSLDLKVIAEGVENHEQFEFLKNINCDILQGNLIGPAQTTSQFEARIRENSPSAANTAEREEPNQPNNLDLNFWTSQFK